MISTSVMKINTAIVVPNWNGEDNIRLCLTSLVSQSFQAEIIVVDNGSVDSSKDIVANDFKEITFLPQTKNLGFAGGVNVGIRYAIEKGYKYVALFNNDAVAELDWIGQLIKKLDNQPEVGIMTGKLLSSDKKHIDSTGDLYTAWGLPYPRGRNEKDNGQFDKPEEVFAASGGASLYRVSMLKEIGLFDEDFFAYFEDVDLSFRAQLAGWKVRYDPGSIAYHQIGATSSKIKGFTTYHTLKNLPWVYWKNVPWPLFGTMFPKIFLTYWSIFLSSCLKGKFIPALKGAIICHLLMPKKLFIERKRIQRFRKVTPTYISSIIVHDVPPNANKLRRIRSFFVRSVSRQNH